jgi:hypothetical protein
MLQIQLVSLKFFCTRQDFISDMKADHFRVVCALLTICFVGGGDAGKHIEVQFLPPHGASSHEEGHDHLHGHPKLNGHGALPLQQFMRLFPLDLPAKAHVKVIKIGPASGDPLGDVLGDHILNSILSELSQGFHSEMKPLLAGLNAITRGEPHPCEPDIEKHCKNDEGHGHKHESELHCLGLHANELTDACAKEVQQSLPFMCSREISRYCATRNTIEVSVLQCLEEKIDAGAGLGDECKDSISATRAVVSKMKTQNVALVDKRTGAIIRSTASALAAPLYLSIYVLVIGSLALLLYAFWARDDETSFFKSITRTFRELRVRLRGGRQSRISQKPEALKTVELKSNYL